MDENRYFETIAEYKLLAKHEVGQNFLVDKDVCKKIVNLLQVDRDDNVLEIGCGAGSLSYFLSNYDNPITLIDIDEALVTKLKNDFANRSNVAVVQANALKFDMSSFTKIIGNLPYYITSSLLERILLNAEKCKKSAIMVQKEVFFRLSSSVKQEGYGPLSLLIAYRADIKKEFIVRRNSFTPSPHVDSVVFSLNFKEEASIETARNLYSFTSKIFLHRRKTILNNLSIYLGNEEEANKLLLKSGINQKQRPEEIDLKHYLILLSFLH